MQFLNISTWSKQFKIFTLAMVVYRIVNYFYSLPVVNISDSSGYKFGIRTLINEFASNGMQRSLGFFDRFAITIEAFWNLFMGAVPMRGWPTLIFYRFGFNDTMRMAMQNILNVSAYIFLAYAITLFIKNKKYSKYIYLLIFIFANLSPTLYFANLILREDFSLSLVIMTAGFVLVYLKTKRTLFFYLTIIFSTLFIIAKPPLLFPGIEFWIIAACILLKLKWNSFNNIDKVNIKFTKILKSLFCIEILLLLILVFYTNINLGNQSYGYSDKSKSALNYVKVNYGYATSIFNPRASELLSYFGKNGAPRCATLPNPTDSNVTGRLGEPGTWAYKLNLSCPEFSAWANSKFMKTYSKFLVENPQAAFAILNSQKDYIFANPFTTDALSILPSWALHFINPIKIHNPLFDPTVILVVAALLLLVTNLRRIKLLSLLSFITLFSAFAGSIVLSLLIAPTHPYDIMRTNFVATTSIRLMVLLGFALLVIKIIESPRTNSNRLVLEEQMVR